MFAMLSVLLYALPNILEIHGTLQNILTAIADALVVSIVVSIAVEPHLLRYFGKELQSFGERLATQTFWASFYSRAPKLYTQAIQELASEEQFSTEANFLITMDWAENSKSIVRLVIELVNYRENRGFAPYNLRATSFVFESHFHGYPAEFQRYQVMCQDTNLCIDYLADGSTEIEEAQDGRLLLQSRRQDPARPALSIPPGAQYTIITKTATHLGPIGYYPLVIARPAMRFTVQLFGSALADLHISLLDFGTPRHRATVNPLTRGVAGNGAALAERGPIKIGGVFITGQTVLLSWKSQVSGPAPFPHKHQTSAHPRKPAVTRAYRAKTHLSKPSL
jgi:hypothetical protein